MADAPAPKDYDVVFVHSPTEDGDGARVLRLRSGQSEQTEPGKSAVQVEAGEVRPVREGRPIVGGEVVALQPRTQDASDGPPRLFNVQVIHKAKPPEKAEAARAGGPAQVATPEYRAHWERIFGKRTTVN